jgi:hypothetical protein
MSHVWEHCHITANLIIWTTDPYNDATISMAYSRFAQFGSRGIQCGDSLQTTIKSLYWRESPSTQRKPVHQSWSIRDLAEVFSVSQDRPRTHEQTDPEEMLRVNSGMSESFCEYQVDDEIVREN